MIYSTFRREKVQRKWKIERKWEEAIMDVLADSWGGGMKATSNDTK
jgi:hypothetical protein